MENYNEAMCHFYGYKLCWEKSFTEIFHLRASVSSKVWLFFAAVHKLCEALYKQTFPSKCLGLYKHLLLPSLCCLKWFTHLWAAHALTLMSDSWSSGSYGFCFCFHFPSPPPFLFSLGLSFFISCSWPCSTRYSFFTLSSLLSILFLFF